MSELPPRELTADLGPEDQARLQHQYLTSWGVRARFLLNLFAVPYVDIDEEVLATLDLQGTETIVDVGTADAQLPYMIRLEHGHEGRILGVDPNASQFKGMPIKPVEQSDTVYIVSGLRKYLREHPQEEWSVHRKSVERTIDIYSHNNLIEIADIEYYEGSAQAMPLDDNTADVLLSMFMLYHVPRAEQPKAFEELKRVLKPSGRAVIATSGQRHKIVHRAFERLLAEHLDIQPPKRMNAGFTTEIAQTEVRQHFKHVYMFRQTARMLIDGRGDGFGIVAYKNSLQSLRDQFDPIPDLASYTEAIEKIVEARIKKAIKTNGAFEDEVHRSIFIASDSKLARPEGFAPQSQA